MFGAKGLNSRKVLFLLTALLLVVGAAAIGVQGQRSALPTQQQTNALKGVGGQITTGEEDELYSADPGKLSGESAQLSNIEDYWYTRISYPTGKYDGRWILEAAKQDKQMAQRVPSGRVRSGVGDAPMSLDPNSWTPLGPAPENEPPFGHTAGRVNDIVIDPVTPNVAYVVNVAGGVWKTTNCCSTTTTFVPVADDPLITTVSIDDISIDPSNHNTIYAGTGDLNYGSFSMGSSGILKSTDAGATWAVKGESVFTPYYPEPPNNFPQYQAVGKVEADPRNSNTVVAGAKTGVYFSYDGGDNWTGPCLPDAFPNQRQDITGLILHDNGTFTDMYVAVGTRGYSSTVQYNLADNGANGIYKSQVPSSGCPGTWTLTSRGDNGWPTGTGAGAPYPANTVGRIDLGLSPSNPNYLYAIAQSIVTPGNVLGTWRTTDAGGTWTQLSGAPPSGGCANSPGNQNWYNQHMTVDPNNPDIYYFDTIDAYRGTVTVGPPLSVAFNNLTCAYTAARTHPDQHAITFLPGSSTTALLGNDGGTYISTNFNATPPAFTQLNDSFNSIEFYSGDITANFATSSSPGINAGAQDNGSSVYVWPSNNVGPALWSQRNGGDGMYARIEPVLGQRWYQESQNGNMVVSTTGPFGGLSSATGGWTADAPRRSFVFPYEIFKGNPAGPPSLDCAPTGCTHMIAGSYRVWETIQGAVPASSWYANSPDLTKNTLADRSFINQLTYSAALSTTAIVGTNDGNVQYGFGLGQGTANTATWVDVTGGNSVLPNRPVLDVATDLFNPLVGYAALGGFDQNTPSTPGHVYRVTCSANCATFTWANKSGNLPNVPIDSIIANPNFPQQVFAGSDWGLYFTDDINQASPTWFKFNAGMPNVMIWDMAIDRGSTTLALFTRGRGAYAWPLPTGPFGASPTPGGPTATRTPSVPPATATATTQVATVTATPTTCGVQTVSGSIDNSDPSHDDYVDLQDPAPSECATQRTCAGTVSQVGPWHYDVYTFTNTLSTAQCVTVDLDASGCNSNGVWALAYLNSFDPTNLCSNYLGDAGSDPIAGPTSFSFMVPGNATFVLEVEEFTHKTGCASYTASVSGLGGSCATATPTSPAVNTPTSTATSPAGATQTATSTQGVAQPTSTTCPISFSDVPVGSTFYEFIRCLACRGIINGYPDGTFKPNNNVTRGQLSKIVSNSAGFSDPATQMFEDVPPGSTFFDYIGRLASRGYINGYPCGGPGEPCVPPGNLPYFRPNANATRGQISKIVSNAAGFIEPVSGQTFEDVPPGSTFYDFIERLAGRGVMSGYPCGSVPTEPCVPPGNRPYFRPNNNATRGQTSKIVANTFFPACVTPSRR